MTPLQIAQAELDKMEIWNEKEQRFTKIKLPVVTVMKIVRHLDAGGSMYQLYRQNHEAALNTIKKVRDARKAGNLDRVLEIAGAPDVQELLENKTLTTARSNALTDAVSILDHTYRAAYGKQWEWDLRHLQEIGVLSDAALGVLKSHDNLYGARRAAETTRRNFTGLELYVCLHYIAVFHIRFPDAPFHYINTAAHIYTTGLLESERRSEPVAVDGQTSSGEDMLRYEIWRGDKHRDTYYEALERYKLNPKQLEKLKAQIERLKEKGNGQEKAE